MNAARRMKRASEPRRVVVQMVVEGSGIYRRTRLFVSGKEIRNVASVTAFDEPGGISRMTIEVVHVRMLPVVVKP